MTDGDNSLLATELLKAHQSGYQEASQFYLAKIRRWVNMLTTHDGELSSSTAFDRFHIELVLMELERELQ